MPDDDPLRHADSGHGTERMQALLVQAAEEQLSDQRQVAAVLADLRELVTGLSRQVDELTRRVERTPSADDVAAALSARLTDERAAGEQRLADHVDEAVLALADVLLRRRRGERGSGAQAQSVGRPSSPADAIGSSDELEAVGAEEGAGPAPDAAFELEAAADGEPQRDGEPSLDPVDPHEPVVPPEQASRLNAPSPPADGRRPWWRPNG